MKLNFEYGHGTMVAELPDSTDVFIPGQTVADPPCIEQTWQALYEATVKSIRSPIGTVSYTHLRAHETLKNLG